MCEDCSEDYGDWALDHALRLQPAILPHDDFVDQAIEYAIHANSIERRHRFALAASVAVVTVAFGLVRPGGSPAEPVAGDGRSP